MPEGVEVKEKYNNIKIVHYGKKKKFFWLNCSFVDYVKNNNAVGIHLGVNVPWIRPDIVCIYDVNSIANPNFFSKYHYIKTKLEKKLAVKKENKFLQFQSFQLRKLKSILEEKVKTIRLFHVAGSIWIE